MLGGDAQEQRKAGAETRNASPQIFSNQSRAEQSTTFHSAPLYSDLFRLATHFLTYRAQGDVGHKPAELLFIYAVEWT